MTAALRLVISGYGGWSFAAVLTVLGILLAWERWETGRLCEAMRERHRLTERTLAAREAQIAADARTIAAQERTISALQTQIAARRR